MNKKQNLESGQAIVLIAFAFIGLVAFAALAIDGSMVYSDRRHAQNASDAGSLAGGGAAALIFENDHVYYSNFNCNNLSAAITAATNTAVSVAENNGYLQSNIAVNDIDNFMVGVNGDSSGDKLYYELIDQLFPISNSLYYKHLCGEFDTASAFAMWLASKMLKSNFEIDSLFLNNKSKPLGNILIYNQEIFKNHSLILLSGV